MRLEYWKKAGTTALAAAGALALTAGAAHAADPAVQRERHRGMRQRGEHP